jgi:hypothetical protein
MNIAALPLLLAVILLAVIRAARRPLAAPV